MADSEVILNPGTGGARMDEEAVDFGGTTRLRSRIVLGGALPGELAKVRNTTPAADDYGVVVRVADYGETATVTAVPASSTVIPLAGASGTRRAMTVYNEPGSANLFLKFGAGASADSYSVMLAAGDYWESSPPRYGGAVTAVWATATGRAMVTEFF